MTTTTITTPHKQFFTALVVIAALLGAAGVNTHQNSIELSPAHAIVKSSCSSTLYPELCYSTLITAETSQLTKKGNTKKSVIELALNVTITNVKQNHMVVEKILNTRTNLTERETTALKDCLETLGDSLDELREAAEDLEKYPNSGKKSLRQHADDLKTLMSSAITNQETCLEGFSFGDDDRKVRKELLPGEVHVEKLCSNALAMITNLTDGDIMEQERLLAGAGGSRKLMAAEEEEGLVGGWPKWLSAGDRRLLQASTVKADVVVAADGSGNFRTVSAAVAAAPEKSSRRYVIRIKEGVYKENVEVPKKKTNIMLVGDGQRKTIITGSRNVVDGSTTFHSATVAAVGERFLARDIGFINTAGPSKHQAVALRVGSDLSAFYRCDMIAYQDTLYVHSNRQFFVECFIAGTVDFIFGNGAVVLQNCVIEARKPNTGQKNMVTAQGRTDPNQNTGIVIQKCRIGASADLRPVQKSFPTYLGRPWKQYSRTVIMQSTISDVINPAGWLEWDGDFALNTLFYGEYQNTGAGAGTSGRVKWRGFKVITSATEAQSFTPGRFIGGDSWLGSTGFPFTLSL